jgi:hypothetical protein
MGGITFSEQSLAKILVSEMDHIAGPASQANVCAILEPFGA